MIMMHVLKRLIIILLPTILVDLNIDACLSQTNAPKTDFNKQTYAFKKTNQHEILADVYTTGATGKRPVIVFFHGGGFVFHNREIGLQPALRDALLKNKYIVVSADYRLAPQTKIDQILKDAEDVYGWTIDEGPRLFNADPAKVVVMGTSAGGHLALHLGLKTPRPKAVVAISSPVDYSFMGFETGEHSTLKTAPQYAAVGEAEISSDDQDKRLALYSFLRVNKLFLYEVFGFDVSKDQGRFKSLLPVNNLDAGYPPTLIVHAKLDGDVPYSQAEVLDAAMTKMKIKHELYTAEEGHSSRLIINNPDAVERIGTFISEQLTARER
jgi:acetyl esterase/lipase